MCRMLLIGWHFFVNRNLQHSHLVYRNAELSGHPEHKALIISSSPPHPLVLPTLCIRLCCSICAYVDCVHTVLHMLVSQV